jgi:ribosome-associated translation inhibitor RaiA
MQVPIEIAFQNCDPSEAVRSEILRLAQRLEKFSSRITSCHVAVIREEKRSRHGGPFKIDIRIAMPGHNDVIVSRSHDDQPEREHVLVAVREAFGAAQRQVEDAVRELRGQVKIHAAEDHGRVAKFRRVRMLASSKPLMGARSISIATRFSITHSIG